MSRKPKRSGHKRRKCTKRGPGRPRRAGRPKGSKNGRSHKKRRLCAKKSHKKRRGYRFGSFGSGTPSSLTEMMGPYNVEPGSGWGSNGASVSAMKN